MPPKSMGASDRGSGRRRMLLLRIFPQKFSPEERVQRCMDAFYELHDGEGPSSTPEEMMKKVQTFVSEADSILGDGREEKASLAQALSGHPWFGLNGWEVQHDPEKNSLNLVEEVAAADSGEGYDWNAPMEEDDEWKEEVKDEEEAALAKAAALTSRGGPGTGSGDWGDWKDGRDWKDWKSDWGGQGSWNQHRAPDRSRSPRQAGRTGTAAGHWDESGTGGTWEDNAASAAGDAPATTPKAAAIAISKAAAIAAGRIEGLPPRAVSKAAAIAAGYMGEVRPHVPRAVSKAAAVAAGLAGEAPPQAPKAISKAAAIAAGYLSEAQGTWQPPRAVSKAAAIAAGYMDHAEARAPAAAPEDPEERRFAEALMRCLPEDTRPWDATGGIQDVLNACHNARGFNWPKFDLVGGGTGGTSSIADLHELSVALLNRVKEKALAEAMPVEEGTELTTMFVKENKLGPDAEAALRAMPVTDNLRVIGAGSVTGCDTQAVVISRIRRAQEAATRPTMFEPPSARDLSAFIEDNWVNTEAEKALRVCSSEVQRLVVAEGPLLGQTPSQELLDRIDQMQVKAVGAAAAA